MEENKGVVCRVCLEIVEKFVSVYEVYNKSRICDYIKAIADVQIREDDGLPDRLCSSCFVELEQVVQFKHKCERSHSILTSTPTATLTEPKEESEDVAVKREDSESEMVYDEPTEDAPEECEDNEESEEKAEWKSRAIDLHLQCDDCKEYFKSKCKLKVHWKRVHLLDALKCTHCKHQCKSFTTLKSHMEKKRYFCKYSTKYRLEKNGKQMVFHCKDCQYKTDRIRSFVSHHSTHTKESLVKCKICSMGFIQHSSLQKHREKHHPEMFEEVQCAVCGQCIKGPMKMKEHMRKHSEKVETCKLCGKNYKSKRSLNCHKLRHKGEKTYTCEICASSFFTSGELTNHKHSVHENNRNRFKCDHCEYYNKRKDVIKLHMKRHNSTNVPCLICGKFLESKQKLQKHHQKIHLGDKLYECPYCDKKFYTNKSIYKHKRFKHKALAEQEISKKKECLNKKPKKEIDASSADDSC